MTRAFDLSIPRAFHLLSLRPDPDPATTILVVAEHALVRAGLRSVLEAKPGLSVVATASDATSAFPLAQRLHPQVVLLVDLPVDETSRVAVAELQRGLPRTCVLCLARSAAMPVEERLSVPASAGVNELCSMLGLALHGRCSGCRFRNDCPVPTLAVTLSRREKQVAVCVAEGLSSKQIAAVLGIALRTVNTYRENLARKIGASSAAVLTRFVLEHQITAPGVGASIER